MTDSTAFPPAENANSKHDAGTEPLGFDAVFAPAESASVTLPESASYSEQPVQDSPETTAWDDSTLDPEEAYEPFVPKPKYKLGRATKVLAGVLLVAVGFLGGVAVNSTVNSGSTRAGKGSYQQSGTGTSGRGGAGGSGGYSGYSGRGNGTGSGTGTSGGTGEGTGTGSGTGTNSGTSGGTSGNKG